MFAKTKETIIKFFSTLTTKRKSHTQNFKRTSLVLATCFPLFLVLLTEFNHLQNFSALLGFLANNPVALLFKILLITALYALIIALVKKAYLSALVLGLVLFTFSAIEFFKFRATGVHFVLSDLLMVRNAGHVAEFADTSVPPSMIICFILLFAYIGALFWLDPVIVKGLKLRLASGTVCAAFLLVTFVSPFSSHVFAFFNVDNRDPLNHFDILESFEHNNLIAFLANNSSQALNSRVLTPQNYSKELIDSLLSNSTMTVSSSSYHVKPNVVIIMSESFADFREFEKLEVCDSHYKNFDHFREQGFSGRAIVPTFGGLTARTEFELMVGLPIKSLDNAAKPLSLLGNNEIPSIARQFANHGYQTAYIHSFYREFYNRDDIFLHYGIDKLIFLEDLLLENDDLYFRDKPDDALVFNSALSLLENSSKPSFIHITTMQNHMPFENDEVSQFEYYLQGIEHSDHRLGEFMQAVENLNRPTIVLFIGDHFPFFTDDSNPYERLNINSQNGYLLHETNYFIWSNALSDFSFVPPTVSAFYLPHVLLRLAGLPLSNLSYTLLQTMADVPIYSVSVRSQVAQNALLNTLTYDIVFGEMYSAQDIFKLSR